MIIRLNKHPSTIILLSWYWGISSLLELVAGYYIARYFRLVFLAVILFSILNQFLKKTEIRRGIGWFWLLTIPVVMYSVLMNINITNLEYLVTYILSILTLYTVDDAEKENIIPQIINIILIFSMIHACGIILERLFTSQFFSLIYTRYPSDVYNQLHSQIYNSSRSYYTGFQREVSVSCAYIIAGLGINIFCKKNGRLRILMLIIQILALLISNKRAFTLFPLVAIILVALLIAKWRGHLVVDRTKLVNTIFAVVAGLILVAVFWSRIAHLDIFQRFIQMFADLQSGEDVTTGRDVLWLASWQLFLTKPLFGIGWSATEKYIRLIVYSSVNLSTHNVYLQLLTETGIVGAVIFAFAFIQATKRILSLNKQDQKTPGILRFCLYYQLFFLIYCVTGVCFTDRSYIIMYIVTICISSMFELQGISYQHDELST